jgi:two-component system, NtrC family, response regulator AtoC
MNPRKPALLIVDDDPHIRKLGGRLGTDAGFEAMLCAGGAEALDVLGRTAVDLALVDLCMPEMNGLEVLRTIRERGGSCEVVLMSGYATIDSAVEAVKLGARDCLVKPLDLPRLEELLKSVRGDHERRLRVLAAEATVAKQLEFCGLIGRGPAMQELFSLIRRFAPHVRTALITGETGTGKELAARALHRLGPRRHRRFVTVNCSAIVETLFETELFGHVRGAFTGAAEGKAGIFEFADGGTLFLDEVGELPATVQAKLLRVLESGEVQRVGSLDTRTVDVHVLAATNRDLQAEVDAGRFRADLYYRLAVIDLKIPLLRDRREDIPYLVAAFVSEFSRRLGKRLGGVTPNAERQLLSATWDGNVRELRNTIERACILAQGDVITERDLDGGGAPARRSGSPQPPTPTRADTATAARLPAPADPRLLSLVEREHVLHVLQQTGGNKKAAAKILGISRRSLYRLLEEHAAAVN